MRTLPRAVMKLQSIFLQLKFNITMEIYLLFMQHVENLEDGLIASIII